MNYITLLVGKYLKLKAKSYILDNTFFYIIHNWKLIYDFLAFQQLRPSNHFLPSLLQFQHVVNRRFRSFTLICFTNISMHEKIHTDLGLFGRSLFGSMFCKQIKIHQQLICFRHIDLKITRKQNEPVQYHDCPRYFAFKFSKFWCGSNFHGSGIP